MSGMFVLLMKWNYTLPEGQGGGDISSMIVLLMKWLMRTL